MSIRTIAAKCFTLLLFLLLAPSVYGAERTIYLHSDALGSPVAASDAAGDLLWREAYRPYGERIQEQDDGANIQWYTGKPHDEDSGLSYFGARYYDPVVGRFMGVDPEAFSDTNFQSFNRYAYGNNNPYAYVDEDGNLPIVPLLYGAYKVGSVAFDAYQTYRTISSDDAGGLEKATAVATFVAGTVDPSGLGSKLKIVKEAGKAAKGADKAEGVTKGGGQTFERVVSNAELKATQQTGLLRGGREGENFFTNSASLDAKRAQQRLGLDGPLRDSRIQFRIKNDVEVTGPRSAAPGQTGTAGGGREFSTNGRTEIEILRVDPLRK